MRLRVAGGAVRPRFVTAPEEGDETIEAAGLRIFIARTIVDELGPVVVDVTPEHGQLTVRPLG